MTDRYSLGLFERYLTIWVLLMMALGTILGLTFPGAVAALAAFQVAQVSIPVAIVLFLMIYPMMVQIDFSKVRDAGRRPKPLTLTLIVNWAIKPFSMAAIAWIFFKVLYAGLIAPQTATEYFAGAVLLGSAPCTAMVFVWTYLARGELNYTLVQVSVNDLVLLALYAPIVGFLLHLGSVIVPYRTVFYSVVLYVVIPLTAGYLSRRWILKNKGEHWLENVFLRALHNVTIGGLLLTLLIIFMFQGRAIVDHPLDIVLIAIPLTLQTFFIFYLGYTAARKLCIRYEDAAPAALVGASNFFELAVATALILFGLDSGATLATVVGVLVEVPVMLTLVKIALSTRHRFEGECFQSEEKTRSLLGCLRG
ncbi:MAG: arsenical-resistance protein [Methanobacteriota archaeon]|nr:MAG: arsenical-resistance protein [Euryarchaeota archaeon]